MRTKGAQNRRKGWLLTVLLGGITLGNIDVAVVNIATPSIHAHLQASGAELELIVSGYTLAFAVLLITSARLGDMFGYRRMFLLGLEGFTLASLACGLAPDAPVLVLARIIQGIAAALMVSQVLTGIQRNFEGDARARALGLYTIALSGSAVLGQILGGVLVSANLFGMEWRSVFLINVPIGAILVIMAARFMPADQAQRKQRLDLAGVSALSLALLLLVVPLVLGQDAGWPAWVWICLLASIPAFATFVVIERRLAARGGSPVLNLRLLTRPAISWGLLTLTAANITYFALLFVLALYLQQGLGKSPTYSGLALVPWVATFGIAGPLVGRLSARSRRLTVIVGTCILMIAYLGIGFSLLSGILNDAWLIVLLGIGGLGLGLEFTALMGHLTSLVDNSAASDMSGLLNTVTRIAGVLGVAIFGTLYFGLAATPGRQPAIHSFTLVTLALATTTLLAVITGWLSIRGATTLHKREALRQSDEHVVAPEEIIVSH